MADLRTEHPQASTPDVGQGEPEAGVPAVAESIRFLLASLDEAFCLVEVIFEQDHPVDYRFLAVNEVFERQTGLLDAQGKTLREFVARPDPFWLETCASVVRTGRSMRIERASTDTGRWYDAFAFRVGEADHRQVGVSLRDITARKQAEIALRDSEERLRRVIEAAPYGVVLTDAGGHITMTNPKAERSLGYGPGELLGRSVDVLVPEHVREDHGDWRRAYLDEPMPRPMGAGRDLLARAKDGSLVPVEIGLSPVATADGPMVLATLVDISRRRQAEAELRESEARFRGTFENAAVGIAHVGLDGRWLRMNETLCRITGYSREELLARTFGDITHPDDLEADWAQARRVLAGELETYTMEKRYIRRDGSIVPIELTGSLVRDEHGAPEYFISVVTDIYARKRAEAELRDALAAKEQFLGFISHELRTPMTIISGMSHLLGRRLTDGEAQEMAADIAASAAELDDLIDSLLLLARLDGKRAEPELAPVRLGRVIDAVLERQRERDPGRSYTFECRVTEPPLVDGEEAWIERVFANLIGNAAKYSPGDGSVIVTLEGEADEVLVRVLDDGDGLQADEIDHLFEPFFRGASHDERIPGAGLGLAVCKRIVESMGGRIWARSRREGGAEFGFALPSISLEAEP